MWPHICSHSSICDVVSVQHGLCVLKCFTPAATPNWRLRTPKRRKRAKFEGAGGTVSPKCRLRDTIKTMLDRVPVNSGLPQVIN